MRVKICGLTRLEDATLAQDLGAFALGFIMSPLSKRFIAPKTVAKIVRDLDEKALRIGVFVNQTQEAIAVANEIPLSGIQLHGDETPKDCAHVRSSFSGLVIKALRLKDAEGLLLIDAYLPHIDYILLDAAQTDAYGGTGKTGDWPLAAKAVSSGAPVILAGGISADNIVEANRLVRPFALDLSSGVESAPGIKDHEKLRQLFQTVKDTCHAP